jgi:outer membrane protein OmpA-like peptidoglycan-associated protein
MLPSRTLLHAFALVACGVSTVAAQDTSRQWWFGIGAGYGITEHSVDGLTCKDGCPQYDGGTGRAPFLGVSADRVLAGGFGVSFDASYFLSSLSMTSRVSDLSVKDESGAMVPLVRDYTLAVQVPELAAGLSGFYHIGRVRLEAGFGAGLILHPTWRSTAHIVLPGNVTYQNGLLDTTFFPTEGLSNARTTQFYLSASGSYSLYRSASVAIGPEARLIYPLTTLRVGKNWKETIIALGAWVRFGLAPPASPASPPPPPKEVVDTVTIAVHTFQGSRIVIGRSVFGTGVSVRTDTLLVGTLPPVAHLTVRAVDSAGVRRPIASIHVEVQFVTEAFPLLPLVFFESGSPGIAAHFAPTSEPSRFQTDSLPPNPLVLSHNILNIVGERMRAHPGASIILRGYADPSTETGGCELARERAESVRRAIVAAWDVDSSRVVVLEGERDCSPPTPTLSRSEEGYAENRRVSIESSDPALLAPMMRKRFLEPVLTTPPAIECDPAGSTTAGIRSWRLAASQEGRVIFADSGTGPHGPIVHPLGPDVARALDPALPIVSSFSVTNESGLTSTASDTVPVAMDTLPIEIQRLSLTLFGTSLDRISPEDTRTIRSFLSGFDASDSISITGYTDLLGEAGFNERLSARRAANVDSLIRQTVPTATRMRREGLASRALPPGMHSYDTPEERFLARTVQIEVRARHVP